MIDADRKALPRIELPGLASAAFGGVIVLMVAAFALRLVRSNQTPADSTDRPVP
jgi:hypothetical protein